MPTLVIFLCHDVFEQDVEVDTLFEWVKSIAELHDLNALSTPDTSPFSVTLRFAEKFPVSMRTLS